MFSFDQDQKVNKKNYKWLKYWPKSLVHNYCFKVVSIEGHVMPPHFFPQGLGVNFDTYIDVMGIFVEPSSPDPNS